MKVIWAVACQASSLDKDTNNVSLFNVIEEIAVSAEPPTEAAGTDTTAVARGDFELVVLWARSDEEASEKGTGRVRILDPDGKALGGADSDVDLSTFLRLRSRNRFMVFPVTKLGMYDFVVEYKTADEDWTIMFNVPVRVKVTENEGTE